jgi:hypothetical protein
MPGADLRAARANRVFCADKKHPYSKHGYGKNKDDVGLLLLKIATLQQRGRDLSRHV